MISRRTDTQARSCSVYALLYAVGCVICVLFLCSFSWEGSRMFCCCCEMVTVNRLLVQILFTNVKRYTKNCIDLYYRYNIENWETICWLYIDADTHTHRNGWLSLDMLVSVWLSGERFPTRRTGWGISRDSCFFSRVVLLWNCVSVIIVYFSVIYLLGIVAFREAGSRESRKWIGLAGERNYIYIIS